MNIALLYLQDKAQKKGTNSFRFVESKNENGLLELIIDAYVIDEETRLQNEAYFPKNKIFFFGRNNTDSKTMEEFKVNGETHTLPAYYFSTINFDNQTTI